MIRHLETVGNSQPQDFYNKLCEVVSKCQSEGLEVEIQYQDSGSRYSALIIGRANTSPHDQDSKSHK